MSHFRREDSAPTVSIPAWPYSDQRKTLPPYGLAATGK